MPEVDGPKLAYAYDAGELIGIARTEQVARAWYERSWFDVELTPEGREVLGEIDTGGNLIQYLIRAQCPNCEEVTGFVEERANPVALDTEIYLSAEFCPNCSFFVAGEADWDIREEARVERVRPVEELQADAPGDTDA